MTNLSRYLTEDLGLYGPTRYPFTSSGRIAARDHVWHVQHDCACHKLIIPGPSGKHTSVTRMWKYLAMVGGRGLGRREKPSRGSLRRGMVGEREGAADPSCTADLEMQGHRRFSSHSIASSRSASTTSTQPMTASTLPSSVSLLPPSHPVRESG